MIYTLEIPKMTTNTSHDGDVVEPIYDYEPQPDFALCVEYHNGSRTYRDYLNDEYRYADIDARLEAIDDEARRVFIVGISRLTSGYQESYK